MVEQWDKAIVATEIIIEKFKNIAHKVLFLISSCHDYSSGNYESVAVGVDYIVHKKKGGK